MRSLVVSLIAILLMVTPQSASACCLFPFFSGCATGWGFPGYAAYRPASYYGGGSNCCASYASSYTAGYGGYANYSGISSGCCGSTCGSSCGSSCGGCSNCATESFSSSKPVPDPISDRDRDYNNNRDRIFNGSDSDRRTDDRGLDDRRIDDREPVDSFNNGTSRSDRDRLDSNAPDWGESRNLNRDPVDSTYDRRGPAASDSEFPPLRDELGPFDGSSSNRSNNRPDFDADTAAPGADPVNRTSNKPPMNDPVDETVPAPAADTIPDDSATQSTAPVGTETDVKDFLSPPDPNTSSLQMKLSQRELRSSRFDVTRTTRLAASARRQSTNATQVSSSRTEVKPFLWISLPLPEGRNRL